VPIYWSSKSIPELALFAKERRRNILRQCILLDYKREGLRWRALEGLVTYAPYIAIITHYEASLYLRGPTALAWVIALTFCFRQRRIVRVLPEIRKRVGGFCVACGYDIRATPERCPECGLTVSGDRRAR
jgi:hypothetical protein